MELAQIFALLAFASLISFINERFVELVIVPRIEGTRAGEWKVVISFATGFFLSALLAIDFIGPLAAMFGTTLRWFEAGWIVSAVVVGCGSPVIHDILSYVSAVKGEAKARHFMAQEAVIDSIKESFDPTPAAAVTTDDITEDIVRRVIKEEGA